MSETQANPIEEAKRRRIGPRVWAWTLFCLVVNIWLIVSAIRFFVAGDWSVGAYLLGPGIPFSMLLLFSFPWVAYKFADRGSWRHIAYGLAVGLVTFSLLSAMVFSFQLEYPGDDWIPKIVMFAIALAGLLASTMAPSFGESEERDHRLPRR